MLRSFVWISVSYGVLILGSGLLTLYLIWNGKTLGNAAPSIELTTQNALLASLVGALFIAVGVVVKMVVKRRTGKDPARWLYR